MDPTPSLHVDVLGPLSVHVDDAPVEVAGPRQRGLLVLLALAQGRTVTADQLLEAVWPAATPESGRRSLHSSVSRLRGQLGPAAARLRRHPEGYRLYLEAEELDVARARGLLARARTEELDHPEQALTTLRRARSLWRGPVLTDLGEILPIAAAAEEAQRLLQTITDALIESAIRAGSSSEVVGIAADAVGREPLREASVRLLMRALAASGRSVEALEAARELRRRLADEAGLDASPELDALQRAIAAGATADRPARWATASVPSVPLFGRDRERTRVQGLLASDRLITVVGPGGVGKTSLALAAARVSDAVVVPLAAVRDPAAVPHALAAALGLQAVRGDVLAACSAFLAERSTLLVLDNCEHVLGTIRDAAQLLLSTGAETRILATSREPLGLPLERVVRLAPLALPEPGGDPRQSAAVALFLDRAERARPGIQATGSDLDAIVDIVRYLDGLPLALELAAGRLSTFSVTELRTRLDRSLDLFGGGRPTIDARHRTLRATLSWSYELLGGPERQLLRHLATFVDGVPLGAAEAVAAELDAPVDRSQVLARLVDASMLLPEFSGDGTRYRMLEVVRAFARDMSQEEGDLDRAEGELIRWALGLVSWVEVALTGEGEAEADRVLRRELPNLRAAWGLARQRGDLDAAVTMGVGLFDAIAYRDLTELRHWVADLAADPSLARHPRAVALFGTAAEARYHAGELDAAEDLARRGLELGGSDRDRWYCHVALSVVALARGSLDDAVVDAQAAGTEYPGRSDPWGVTALAAAYAGDLAEAGRRNDQAARLATSTSMRSWIAYVAGEIESLAGHHGRAQERYAQAIDLARTSGATFLVGVANVGLVAAHGRGERPSEALPGYVDTIDYFARTGNWTHLWATLRNLAHLLERLGDVDAAAAIAAAADHAPEAPTVVTAGPSPTEGRVAPAPDRNEVVAMARRTIGRHLRRVTAPAGTDITGADGR